MKNRPIMLSPPKLDAAALARLGEVLRQPWLETGEITRSFEEAFSAIIGAPALATDSGTAALHLAYLLADLRGGEVILSPMTFCATANMLVHAGGVPVFADIMPDTLNIDPDQVRSRITGRTRAVVAVHMAGHPCELSELRGICRQYGLLLIEDCAHALGARYRGRPVGADADLACFSFHPTKNITTIRGGALLSTRDDMMKRARLLAGHGLVRPASSGLDFDHDVLEPGFKYTMTNVQAALGLEQLRMLPEMQERRRRIAALYDAGLRPPVRRPPASPDTSWHLYVVRLPDRDRVARKLWAQDIQCGAHYRPLHRMTFYRNYPSDCPRADRAFTEILSLPMHPGLTDEDADRVICAVNACV